MKSAASRRTIPSTTLRRTAEQTASRISLLSTTDVTSRHLTGSGIRRRMERCLEVGAGGRVDRAIHGAGGSAFGVTWSQLTSTPTGCRTRCPPTSELRCHDIGIDPLPDAAFDVIHARAVLTFVPERRTALRRMIAALKPSGWLLIEELLPPITEARDRPDEPDVRWRGRRD